MSKNNQNPSVFNDNIFNLQIQGMLASANVLIDFDNKRRYATASRRYITAIKARSIFQVLTPRPSRGMALRFR